MVRSSVVIVSPALAAANNGNWQTARRWRQHLASAHRVRITDRWPDGDAARDQVMLALHARRSADAVAAWAGTAQGGARLAVVLTGTDLYQADLAHDAAAQRSLALASRLVVLQDQAPDALPAALRHKVCVIYQSAPARQPLAKPSRHLRVAVVGHLRDVKSPGTVFAVAQRLAGVAGIRIDHVGDADAGWAAQARAAEAANGGYRWLGPLPHAQARRLIQRAHLLLHPSAVEGGAHVVMEAVCSGTPVLASRVPGNVGMLGGDYAGYFPHGDAEALAQLLLRCRGELGKAPDGTLLATLRAQCGRRARLFDPDAERRALLQLMQDLLDTP
jgi:putative glycosyltransferase (TIGR04348 family)